MHSPKPVYLVDWILTTVRWLALLTSSVQLAAGSRLTWPVILALCFAAGLSALVTLVSGLQGKRKLYPFTIVIADICIAYTIFLVSGGTGGNLAWMGILPLLSASLYFGWKGSLLVAGLNIAVQSSLAWIQAGLPAGAVAAGELSAIYLSVGLVFSFFASRLNSRLFVQQQGVVSIRQEEEAARREHRDVVYDLISALSATLNYQRVLDTALDLTSNALIPPDVLVSPPTSAVLLFSQNGIGTAGLKVGSARGLSQTDLRLTVPGVAGLLAHAIEESAGQMTDDITGDPELNRFIAFQTCKSAYCLPLRSGLNTYGVLVFAHPDPQFFGHEQRELLDIVAHQVSIAIQNAQLYHDLEQEKERLMNSQEDARKKMARDLHDGPTQSVAAIAMRVNFARRIMERDQQAAADELYKIEDLARRTTKEIRHMLFTLRPLVLETQGLVAALESMADKMRETYNQNVLVQADPGIVNELEMGKQTVIFYLAEEAVNNARKHAQAEHIWVRLRPLPHDLALLEIQDDGIGFDVAMVEASYEDRGSLGLVNLRERAELVNGLLHIDSSPGLGTNIQVAIPLNENAADRLRRRE